MANARMRHFRPGGGRAQYHVLVAALETCRYLIDRVRARAGRRWRQGARPLPLLCDSTAEEARLVAERRLSGVPEIAARALCGWVDGRRPAVRLHHAPAPRQLLAMAARGLRPVSLLDGDGGLDFVLHDLCHLEKFADPAHHAGQVRLFALLDGAIDGPGWAEVEAGLDDAWRAHRDHVLADMNGSPVYLWLVLRARLQEACARAGVGDRVRQFAAVVGVPDGTDRARLHAFFAGEEEMAWRARPATR
jgi:hypothetical protein